MRTWFLAVLLALVTLQSAGAAAGRSCLHAPEPASTHPATPAQAQHAAHGTPPSQAAQPCFPGDVHCEACHGHCAVVPVTLLGVIGPQPPPPAARAFLPPASALPETPDRPQWA